jgi:tripartite-type tricarboxylate transporter receptor subunit TctC
MTSFSLKLSSRLLFTAACALAGPAVMAQAAGGFPGKTVDITVPYPPGGGVDLLARLIGTQLATDSGQAVVVENRSGAGGTVGAKYVTGRPKDGHSLLMTNDAYSLAPAIYKSLAYDPKKDLEGVINVAWAPMLVLVPGNSRFKTLADIVAAGSKPDAQMSYASCGTGTDPHLAGEMLNMSFKMRVSHVPYKGCAPAMVDVLGGQVDYGVITISGALPYLASGKMRALAITSKARSKAAPTVPTVAESGAPGYELSQWQGLMVPAGTPEETKALFMNLQDSSGRIQLYLRREEIAPGEDTTLFDVVIKKLLDLGYTPADDNPAAFQKIVGDDIVRFDALAKKIGLKLD